MIFFEKLGRISVKVIFFSLLISLLFLVYCYFSIYVLKSDYVNVFGYTFFEVGSGSMSPTILSNDVVIVKLGDTYLNNDIVTFRYGDNFVTHRIIEIDDDRIVTKGDANNVRDISVDKSSIIGKVVYIWKNVGIWKKVFLSPRVVVLVIITLILFIITFSYDSRLYKRFRKRKLSFRKIKRIKKELYYSDKYFKGKKYWRIRNRKKNQDKGK